MTVFRLTGPGTPVSQGPTDPDTGRPDLPDITRPLGLKEAFLNPFRFPSRNLAAAAAVGVALVAGSAVGWAPPTFSTASAVVVAYEIHTSELGAPIATVDGPASGADEGAAGSVLGLPTRHLDPDDAWVMETIAAALDAEFDADQIATNNRFNTKEITPNDHGH